MSWRISKLTLIAFAVATLIAAAGCGNGDNRTARQVVLASADATAKAKTARMAITVDTTGVTTGPSSGGGAAGAASAGSLTGTGSFDFPARTGRMIMKLQTGQPEPVEIEVRTIGSTVFEKLPSQLTPFLGNKAWLRIDLDKLSDVVGFDVSSLASAQSSDPTAAFAMLRGASDDVTKVGNETLRGVETTHYHLTVNVQKAAAAAPPEQKAAMDQVVELYGATTMPMDVWVDGDDRLRKVVQTIDMAQMKVPGTGGTKPSGSIKMAFELFDFGVEVVVDEPPPGEVTNLTDLMPGAVTTTTGR